MILIGSFFENLKDKITSSPAYQTGRAVVEWALDKLWPVYSMGMIVAAVSLVGAVHEKLPLDGAPEYLVAELVGGDDVVAQHVRRILVFARNSKIERIDVVLG